MQLTMRDDAINNTRDDAGDNVTIAVAAANHEVQQSLGGADVNKPKYRRVTEVKGATQRLATTTD
jgi:hypothetical protein